MNYSDKYGYSTSSEAVAKRLQEIYPVIEQYRNTSVLKNCFSLMDLTTLRSNDTDASVKALVEKVRGLAEVFPGYPSPASVCVYPNFAHIVRESRTDEEMHVTAVSSCFPSTQSFLEVKILETRLAIRDGADEIDIVLSLSNFCSGRYGEAAREVAELRRAVDEEAARAGRKVVLKVILETGLIGSCELIAEASFIAMEAGADFIKTSTGKVDVNATPEAALVMCECIAAYYRRTGRKVGFKAAGGISTAEDALRYYAIVASVLGEGWLNKEYFRFGVSRLGNSLVSAIEGKEVKYF